MKDYDLYIVPTPIGNLSDVTLRAIEVLKMVDVIACEDSRVTQKLLNHYDIKTKCISYHKFNEKERIEKFLEILSEGKKIALVSDAGTPLFCDPGVVLVEELKKKNYKVTSLAGANAVATFLSQVPREAEDFAFVGFIPKTKSQIEKLLDCYKLTDMVFYDSPNRILNTLNIIKEFNPNSHIAVGRELTKIFEEVVIDSVDKVIEYFENNILKGEIVALVFRNKNTSSSDIDEKIEILKNKNYGAKDISTILSALYGCNKNEIYKKSLN